MRRKKRRQEINEAADKIKEYLNNAGYETSDADDLFSGVDRLYRKPTIEQVVEEELPIIQSIYPDIFIRNRIDTRDIPQQLLKMYREEDLGQVHWSFKVAFRHIKFFLRDAPEETEQLEETIETLKLIFNGRLIEEGLLLGLFYTHSHGEYEDYQQMKKRLKEGYCQN